MKKFIYLFFVVLLASILTHAQVMQQVVINSVQPSSGTNIIADLFINMNTSTPGTQLTTTIMANGTNGSFTSWSATGVTSGYTVGAHQTTSVLLHAVQIGATNFPIGTTSQSLSYNNANAFQTVEVKFPTSITKVSVGGFLTFGPPNDGFSSGLFDYIAIKENTAGNYAVAQLKNGNACSAGSGAAGYALEIETGPSPVTHSSTCQTITSGGTYWVSLQANYGTGTAQLAVFNNTTGAQVGSTLSATLSTTSSSPFTVWFGNGESHTDTATSFFENLVIDYTNGVFPLGP